MKRNLFIFIPAVTLTITFFILDKFIAISWAGVVPIWILAIMLFLLIPRK